MRKVFFPLLATAAFAVAGVGATFQSASAADLPVTPRPYHVRVYHNHDYGRHYTRYRGYRDWSADTYYRYRRVEYFAPPPYDGDPFYDEPIPVVVYGPPLPPEPPLPYGYYRQYGPPMRYVDALYGY
jgi:hypothetical protein